MKKEIAIHCKNNRDIDEVYEVLGDKIKMNKLQISSYEIVIYLLEYTNDYDTGGYKIDYENLKSGYDRIETFTKGKNSKKLNELYDLYTVKQIIRKYKLKEIFSD